MGLVKGGFQRLLQTALYFIIFLCAAIILGIYSYFLSVLADRNIHIPTWEKAVEGISGAAVLYLIFATILTCCLGGVSFFAFMAIALDLLFCAGMIAIAVMTRDGADSCKGTVQTPIGNGQASSDNGYGNFGTSKGENLTYKVHLGLACRLNTVCFAVAIIAALLFICTAVMQVMLVRHHKKEKRYGPSPSNNYTSGYGKGRFSSFGRKKKAAPATTKDTELGSVGRSSYTAQDSTLPPSGTHTGGYGDGGYSTQPTGYNTEPAVASGAHGGYYTAPTGTAASNPYGYKNTATNY